MLQAGSRRVVLTLYRGLLSYARLFDFEPSLKAFLQRPMKQSIFEDTPTEGYPLMPFFDRLFGPNSVFYFPLLSGPENDTSRVTSLAALVREAFRNAKNETDTAKAEAAIELGFTALRELNHTLDRAKRAGLQLPTRLPPPSVVDRLRREQHPPTIQIADRIAPGVVLIAHPMLPSSPFHNTAILITHHKTSADATQATPPPPPSSQASGSSESTPPTVEAFDNVFTRGLILNQPLFRTLATFIRATSPQPIPLSAPRGPLHDLQVFLGGPVDLPLASWIHPYGPEKLPGAQQITQDGVYLGGDLSNAEWIPYVPPHMSASAPHSDSPAAAAAAVMAGDAITQASGRESHHVANAAAADAVDLLDVTSSDVEMDVTAILEGENDSSAAALEPSDDADDDDADDDEDDEDDDVDDDEDDDYDEDDDNAVDDEDDYDLIGEEEEEEEEEENISEETELHERIARSMLEPKAASLGAEKLPEMPSFEAFMQREQKMLYESIAMVQMLQKLVLPSHAAASNAAHTPTNQAECAGAQPLDSSRVRVFYRCADWMEGQLEQELEVGTWVAVRVPADVILHDFVRDEIWQQTEKERVEWRERLKKIFGVQNVKDEALDLPSDDEKDEADSKESGSRAVHEAERALLRKRAFALRDTYYARLLRGLGGEWAHFAKIPEATLPTLLAAPQLDSAANTEEK